jgi:hypothetical protein
MKLLFFVARRQMPARLMALMLATQLVGRALGDSIVLTETWQDKSYSADTGSYISTDTGTLSTSLTIPGLSAFSTADWSNLVVTISMYPYQQGSGFNSASMADAPGTGGSLTPTSATFYCQGTDTNGLSVNIEKLVFTRTGNVLTIADQTLNPSTYQSPMSLLAANYLYGTNQITDAQVYEVDLQDELSDGTNFEANVVRTLYITGTDAITTNSIGAEFNKISITGVADFTPPTLTAVTPLASGTVATALLNVQVEATDTYGVTNVEFYLNEQDYGPGSLDGTSKWAMVLALRPGANLIQTTATDSSGNVSATNSLVMRYVNPQTNANLIAVSEHLLGSLITDNSGDSYLATQNVGVLNVAYTVPGLQSLPAQTWSNLELAFSLGNFSFAQPLATANVLSPTNAAFYVNYISEANGTSQLEEAETISISRAGNTLVLVSSLGNSTFPFFGQTNAMLFNYVAANYQGQAGSIQDQPNFSLTLQDSTNNISYLDLNYPVYLTGKNTITTNSDGDQLDNIQLSGSADFVPPTNRITAPVAGQLWSNAVFTATGVARDNVRVTNVVYSLNLAGWLPATSTNQWTNWTALVTLAPGTNTLAACAVDENGNVSSTNTVNFMYVVRAPLAVTIAGLGGISPNYTNALLNVGQNYTLTALPATGFTLGDWIVSTNGLAGPAVSQTNLQFMMISNLAVLANFTETSKPTLTIVTPTTNQHLTNALAAITGTAKDIWNVADVWYQLNSGPWTQTATTNNWTNWNQTVSLAAGTNTVRAYAVNLGGNHSTTNGVSFVSNGAFKLQLAASGLQWSSATGFTLTLQASTNLNGHLQYSTNLLNWVTFTNFSGNLSPWIVRDPSATNSPIRFYRATIP